MLPPELAPPIRLLAVAEIGGTPDVAGAPGIAGTIVEFHLESLFEKTGARRQADPAGLSAGYTNLLAG